MELAVICLSVALLVLAIVTAVLAGSVPYLWHRAFRLEGKIEAMDEVLSETLETIGLRKGKGESS